MLAFSEDDFHSPGMASGALRPWLFRSDFLAKSQADKLKGFAQKGVSPGGVSYSSIGFPSFSSPFEVRLPRELWRSERYGRYCNQKLAQAVQNDPTLIRQIGLSSDDLIALRKGANPDGWHWHHHQNPGRMQIVHQDFHKTKSTRHIGGGKIWGPKSPTPVQMQRIILARWGKLAAVDMVITTGSLWLQDELFKEILIREYSSIATAFLAASTVEYIIIQTTRAGGPAGWVAGGTYIIARLAVTETWKAVERKQLEEQEQLCSEAEKTARWQNYMAILEEVDSNLLERGET